MKFIFLGASSHLAQKLIQNFRNSKVLDIVCLYRNHIYDVRNDTTQKFQAFEQIQEYINQDSVVINFICCYGKYGEDFKTLEYANFELPLKFYRLSEQNNAAAFLNCGTVLPDDYSPYAYTKNKLFNHIRKSKSIKCKFIELSLQAFYGIQDKNFSLIDTVIEACSNDKEFMQINMPSQLREFVHIDDVVSAIEKITHNLKKFNQKEQKIDIGSKRQLKLIFICEYIKKKTQSQINFIEGNSDFLFEVPASNLELLEKLGWSEEYTFENYVNIKTKGLIGKAI
ncbi:NAD-dependent epimerase/dehydratase family protein [Amylibacter sp.]|nr:NAD-dependent epimerase/dehydratase family protein [Amylibacter sp.]MDB4095646.1 NAD-dependent epimerase/dehydratase family protein [Amylibacter sp.]